MCADMRADMCIAMHIDMGMDTSRTVHTDMCRLVCIAICTEEPKMCMEVRHCV